MSESKSILAIANEVNALEILLLESGGEITPEIENYLSVKETQLPEKVDSYYFIREKLKANEAYYKERAEVYSKAAKSFKVSHELLSERLKFAMTEMNLDEIRGHDFRFVRSAAKPTLNIKDQSAIPKEYFTPVTEMVLEKEKLLEDLKLGEVAGAEIIQTYSLRPYANTPAKKKAKKDE